MYTHPNFALFKLKQNLHNAFDKIFNQDAQDLTQELDFLAQSLRDLINSRLDINFIIHMIDLASLLIQAKYNSDELTKLRKGVDRSIFSLLIQAVKASKMPCFLLRLMCWPIKKNDDTLETFIQEKSQPELEQYFISKLKFNPNKEATDWNTKKIHYLMDALRLNNKPISSKEFDKGTSIQEKFKLIKQMIEYNKLNHYFVHEVNNFKEISHFHIIADALKNQQVITHIKIKIYRDNLKEFLDAILECSVTHLRLEILIEFKYVELNKILKEFFSKNKTLLSLNINLSYEKLIETNFKWLAHNTTLQKLVLNPQVEFYHHDEKAFINLSEIISDKKCAITTLKIRGSISEHAKHSLALILAHTKIKVLAVGRKMYSSQIENNFTPLILAVNNLVSLDFSHFILGNKDILALTELLKGKNQLRHLNICNTLDTTGPNRSDELESVKQLIPLATQLTSLQLDGNELDADITCQVFSLEKLKCLSVDLNVDAKTFYNLLNENQNLNKLTLHCSPFQLQPLFLQAESLQQNPNLHCLNFKLNINYRNIIFEACLLESSAAKILVDSLSNTSIIGLHSMNIKTSMPIIKSPSKKFLFHKFYPLTRMINNNRSRFNKDLYNAYCFAYFNIMCFQGKFDLIKYEDTASIKKQETIKEEWKEPCTHLPIELGLKIISYLPLLKGRIGEKLGHTIYKEMLQKAKRLK